MFIDFFFICNLIEVMNEQVPWNKKKVRIKFIRGWSPALLYTLAATVDWMGVFKSSFAYLQIRVWLSANFCNKSELFWRRTFKSANICNPHRNESLRQDGLFCKERFIIPMQEFYLLIVVINHWQRKLCFVCKQGILSYNKSNNNFSYLGRWSIQQCRFTRGHPNIASIFKHQSLLKNAPSYLKSP